MNAERGRELDRGLVLITEALEARPDNAAYIDTRGWIYFMQGNYAEARDDIERANSLMPNDPTVTDHLGDIYEKLGVIEEAVDWWKKSFLLDPENEKVAEKLTRQNVDLAPLRKETEERGRAENSDTLDTLFHLAAPETLLKGSSETDDKADDSYPGEKGDP
ncbi:MAG: tetratricopeptide repeat protein [Kiritimatiellae bacterium]|nr:tetratricopeptide repeat protein [Kiritimatiellia bacterium]